MFFINAGVLKTFSEDRFLYVFPRPNESEKNNRRFVAEARVQARAFIDGFRHDFPFFIVKFKVGIKLIQ